MNENTKRTESAGGIVLNKDGAVLLVHQNGLSWSFPKGHIEEGEVAEEAARREIFEESGVRLLTLIKPLGSYSRYKGALGGGDDYTELKTIHQFLFTTQEMDLAPQEKDTTDARWVEKEKVANTLTYAKDKEFFLRILPDLK